MLPFLGGFNTVRAFSSSCGAVIVTSKFPERYPAGAPARIWYDELMQGRLGYRVALEIGGGARGLLQYEREMRNPDPSFSVLHKVNPRVTLLLPASSI
jgi:hypothetical protein